MRTNFNIEDPLNKKHLQENPFKVPAGYFDNLRISISDKISVQKQKTNFWTVVKPQLGLVSAFAMIFLFAYGVFKIFPGQDSFFTEGENELTTVVSSNSYYVEEGFLNTTFIDFFYNSLDSLTTPDAKIDQDELFNYISENIDLVTLSYLDLKD
ncbi:MAG: hypothetical protein WCR71_04680 [Bacteroidales bacterium]